MPKGETRRPERQRLRISGDTSLFIVLLVVSFLLLFVSTQSFIVNFRDLGLSVFSGLRNGIYSASAFMSDTVTSVRELAALRQEYNELLDRVARYEQLERNASEILQENNRLREQLNFAQTLSYKTVPAEIIGRDPDNLYSALVINKGRSHGVDYNMPVIAYQDGVQALVGKVVQAGQLESLVMPLYDPSSFIPARIASSRYDGLVEGMGGSDSPLMMSLVSKQARSQVQIGDIVTSSGLGGVYPGAVYPSGVNIGRVSRIIYQDYESTMELELEIYLDFSRLEYVFVVAPAESVEEAGND